MNAIEHELMRRRQALRTLPAHEQPAELPADGSAAWGLALSGGGIRSATFCFGLLCALARHRLLLRFDLLSTVSGGGYVGAMLGRLFSRARSPGEACAVADAMADAGTRWFAWWLRANGRYLIPRGAKDRSFAVALFLRNLIGVHFELGLMAMLLGVALASLDLGAWALLDALAWRWPETLFPAARHLPGWLPVLALSLPLLVLAGACVAVAYWCVPWLVHTGRCEPRRILPLWLPGWLLLFALWPGYQGLDLLQSEVGDTLRRGLWVLAALLLLVWLLGVPLAAKVLRETDIAQPLALRADAARSRLTKWLANCLRTAGVIALLGLVDRAAWFLAYELDSTAGAGLALALSAALARALLPAAATLLPGRGSTRALLLLGRLLGYALTFALCAWWVSLVYSAGLGAAFQRQGPSVANALLVLAALGLPVLAYLWFTGRNLEFLNLSSLHAFYKARLMRSYLGAANGRRFGRRHPLGALGRLPTAMPDSPVLVAVGDLQADDDVPLDQYLPQRQGGPVHLINVCINQTRDPRGGLFNQDRRGLGLALASGGHMQVSQQGWQPCAGPGGLSLGAWTAISGAAVAPGLGSLSRGGISALATFAGLRLGYWWDKALRSNDARQTSPRWAKSVGLLRETFGIFRGTDRPDWFLTDGGHFENTGAYALLAERAAVIVLADCGADPRYAFGDLENLVRKARIDLQAELVFQRPRARPGPAPAPPAPALAQRYRLARPAAAPPPPWPPALQAFGSLNDLASSQSSACLALARIRYGGKRPGSGILIVVKPNVSDGLPVDLINFKAENPEFPQQTTADQFFSEAQWESYFQLGQFLGGKLDGDFVRTLAADPGRYFDDDEQQPFERADSRAQRAAAEGSRDSALSRLPARIGAAAVNTTLGLGAAATLGVSTWQAIDSLRSTLDKKTSDERAALKELTTLWASLPAAAASGAQELGAVSAMAAAIVRTADTLCPDAQAGWFQRSPLAAAVYTSTLRQCEALAEARRPQPCRLLLAAADPRLEQALPNCLLRQDGVLNAIPPPRYWLYDYAPDARLASAHPCDPVAAERRRAAALARGERAMSELPPACGQARTPLRQPQPAPSAAPSASAPASAPTVPTSAPAAPPSGPPCRGKTIFLQIYGPEQRAALRAYREPWRGLGASVPPIEDVLASAAAAGRANPLPVRQTTVRYHGSDSLACAQALAPAVGQAGWRIEPLAARLKPLPGVLEVWVAPPPALD